MNPILIIIAVFAVTIILGMPFTWSLMISSIAGCAAMGSIPLTFFAQRMFTGAERYTLLAIFFFMLAGALMQYGGISRRLINFSKALVGFMPGGLSIVVILTCVFFSAISGSSIATTAAIGGMLYPELVKAGYPEDYAAALPVVGGTLGIVIPPSIVFIVYGTAVNASISKLLLSGVIPGLLGGLGLCVYAYIIAKGRHFSSVNKFSWKEIGVNLKSSFFALLMPVVILGGIYAGIFTPTESAAVAVVYGFIISAFVYKELSWKQLKMIVIESVKNTSNILLLIMAANVFGWVLTANNVAALFGDFITTFIHNKYVFLL
ncbi:MAG: TRAP transporter large permease, partial [Treponema socranskii subsp. buccale]